MTSHEIAVFLSPFAALFALIAVGFLGAHIATIHSAWAEQAGPRVRALARQFDGAH